MANVGFYILRPIVDGFRHMKDILTTVRLLRITPKHEEEKSDYAPGDGQGDPHGFNVKRKSPDIKKPMTPIAPTIVIATAVQRVLR